MDPLDPGRTPPLSPDERAALAWIEAELLEKDPRSARELTPRLRAAWFPLTTAQTAVLTGLLTLLVMVASVIPAAQRSVLGPFTVVSATLWLAWCARHPRPIPAPPPGGTA